MLVFALALLTVWKTRRADGQRAMAGGAGTVDDLCYTYDLDLLPAAGDAARRAGGWKPARRAVALLAGFGRLPVNADRPVITPLGRWAVHRLEDAYPARPTRRSPPPN